VTSDRAYRPGPAESPDGSRRPASQGPTPPPSPALDQVFDNRSLFSLRAAVPATWWRAGRGHGLWVVRQVCDQVGVDHGPGGTIVTVAFTTV
jgi:hypothetical protein